MKKMRGAWFLTAAILATLLTASLTTAQKSDQGEVLLQAASHKQVAEGQLEEAIQLYKRVIQENPGNRALAAKALLQMGQCYEKLGNAEAQKAYQRILRDYADQPEATEARTRLADARTRGTRESTSPGGLSYHLAWKPPGRDTYALAVSPDGRYIAYENDDQYADLFLHDLATGADRRLTNADKEEGSEGDSAAFSRDGKQLAYSWHHNQGNFSELRVIDLQGSGIPQPRRLFVDKDVEAVDAFDWTPDGKWIAVGVDRNDRRTNQIALISTSDGSLRLLKSVDQSTADVAFMCLSPDAKYLAFESRPGRGSSAPMDVFLLAIDGRQEIPAVVNRADDRLVGWSPDGTRLLFTSDRTGSTGLFALPVSDGRPQGEPELIRPDVGRLSPVGLTTSGSLYSFERGVRNADVKIGSFDFSTGEILSPPADLVLQYFAGSNRSPDWSPDGKSLAYVVEHGSRAGEFSLAVRSLETDQVQELRPPLGRVDWLRWAPDGKSFVVSARDVKGVSGLWRVDRTTAEVSIIAPGSAFAGDLDFNGWSPDPRKIYYHQMRTLSGDQVLVLFERDLASGLERELCQEGPWFVASLSADGKKLYCRQGKAYVTEPSALKAALIERNLASGVEKELIRGNLGGAALSPDGQYIATSTADLATKSQSIMLVPVAGGEPRVLMRVALPQSVIDRWMLAKNLNQLNMLRILWAPDSRSLVVEHTQAKPEQWWVPVDGREPPKRVSLGAHLWNVRVHPDGRRIAIAAQQPRRPADVWVLDHFLPATPPASTGIVARQVWTGLGEATGISRDGRYLAHVGGGSGMLSIRDLLTGEDRRLAVPDSGRPFAIFSPDGKSIAYRCAKCAISGRDEMRLIALDGSVPRVINRSDEWVLLVPIEWSSDGKQILGWAYSQKGNGQIVLVSVADGSVRILKTLEAWGSAEGLGLSPDGRYVVYAFTARKESAEHDIFILATDGGGEVPLVTQPADDRDPVWTPDGSGVLFLSTRAGSTGAWFLRIVDGKPQGSPELVKRDMGRISQIGFTRNGSLYYKEGPDMADLYTATLDPTSGIITGRPATVTQRLVTQNGEVWSPNGQHLAYSSRRSSYQGEIPIIVIRSVHTGEEYELAPALRFFDLQDWSPDSSSLLVTAIDKDGRRGAYRVDARTGDVALLAMTGFAFDTANWFANGKSIVFGRSDNPEGRGGYIVERDLETGHETEWYHAPASLKPYYVEASPDGGHLAFILRDPAMKVAGASLMVMTAAGEKPRKLDLRLKGSDEVDSILGFTPDSRQVLFNSYDPGQKARGYKYWRIAVEGGADPQEIRLNMDRPVYTEQMSFHPDGRRIAFTAVSLRSSSKSAVWVMENFLPALKAAK